MSHDPSNPEPPYGLDPAALPGDAPDPSSHNGITRNRRADAALVPLPRASVPTLLRPEHDPIKMLSEMFDLAIAANAILVEQFGFHEIYQQLIHIFRNDRDPKVRMAAGDRLLKLFRDALIIRGAIAKTTDTMKVRSPDGTIAEREIVTRQIMRSFYEETNDRSPELASPACRPDSPPLLPTPQPADR